MSSKMSKATFSDYKGAITGTATVKTHGLGSTAGNNTMISENLAQLHVSTYKRIGNAAMAFKGSAKPSESKACVQIQAFFRGYIVRARLQRLKHLRWAIRTIQAWVRGIFARRKIAAKGQLIRIGSKRARVFNRDMMFN